jgi:hypothetical protein
MISRAHQLTIGGSVGFHSRRRTKRSDHEECRPLPYIWQNLMGAAPMFLRGCNGLSRAGSPVARDRFAGHPEAGRSNFATSRSMQSLLRSCHPRRGIIPPLDFIRLRRDGTYRSQLTIGCFAACMDAAGWSFAQMLRRPSVLAVVRRQYASRHRTASFRPRMPIAAG